MAGDGGARPIGQSELRRVSATKALASLAAAGAIAALVMVLVRRRPLEEETLEGPPGYE